MAEGGVGHGKNDFSPEFREYMDRELYDSSKVEGVVNWYSKDTGWVFWDRRDGYPDLTLPNDHSVDFNPNLCPPSLRVRLRIRRALHELLAKDLLWGSLIQFWAPTKTLEGRTYLTVQNQPFAFGLCFASDREVLCRYRMGICDLFNAYAESAEEHLGLPARVFLHKLPGFAPYQSYYTLEEHPPLDLTPCWPMKTFWALPVFDYDSYTCVGVLDIVSHSHDPSWIFDRFRDNMGKILQEFGLSCLDESTNRKMQCEDKNKARMAAVEELQVACKSVSEIPEVCFAFAWISCHYCSDLLQLLFEYPPPLWEVNSNFYHRKVQVIGSKLPSSNLLYCSDVRQLSIHKSLLERIDYAHIYRGCFTMCLRSRNAAELYVVQFFLSTHFENHKNKLTIFRWIMDTMKGFSISFRLANGQDWGEGLCLEVMDFRNYPKIHSSVRISATGCTPALPYQPSVDSIDTCMYAVSESQNSNSPYLGSLLNGTEGMEVDSSDQKGHSVESVPATRFPSQWHHPSPDSINNGISELQSSYTIGDPSLDSFSNGIERMQLDSCDQASVDPSNIFVDQEQRVELIFDDRTSAAGAFRNPEIQDETTVTIKAELENCDHLLLFSLSLPPRLVELQDKVAERKPKAGACDVFSIDKENGLITIGCDDELQQWIEKSRSLGNTSTRVLLRPKQPIPT